MAHVFDEITSNTRSPWVKLGRGKKVFMLHGDFDGASVEVSSAPNSAPSSVQITSIGAGGTAVTAGKNFVVDGIGDKEWVSFIVSGAGGSTGITLEIQNTDYQQH